MGANTDFSWSDWPITTGTTTATDTQVSSGYVYIDEESMAKLYPMPVYIGDSNKYGIKVYNDFNIKKEDKNMMGLYEMVAINTKTNEFFSDKFVAKNSNSAERKLIKKYPAIDEWDEDYLKFFHTISVEWETEKPKEVRIVKDQGGNYAQRN